MATIKTGFGSDVVSESSFAVSSSKLEKTVFVTLDEKPATAKVVRDGFQVPSVKANVSRVDQFLSGLQIVKPTESPRVVAQSVAAGTKVGPGTVIDLVLAPREDVPLGIFDNIHSAVAETSVATVLGRIEGDKVLKDLVLKYDSADAVTETDRATLVARLQESAAIPIDDTRPDQDFATGFNTARAALAFK
jgi:hypothetical protein